MSQRCKTTQKELLKGSYSSKTRYIILKWLFNNIRLLKKSKLYHLPHNICFFLRPSVAKELNQNCTQIYKDTKGKTIHPNLP